jgi:hypothetical protein
MINESTNNNSVERQDLTSNHDLINSNMNVHSVAANNNNNIPLQQNMEKSCSCHDKEKTMYTNSPPSYVYALGRVAYRFPDKAIEWELYEAIRTYSNAHSDEVKGKIDQDVVLTVLSDPKYNYILRKLCWIFKIENLETYILLPRNPFDYDKFIETIRKVPKRSDIDVVIGMRGSLSEPYMCNGLVLPVVYFDQLYSSDVDEFITSIGGPSREEQQEKTKSASKSKDKSDDKTNVDNLEETVRDVLDKIMQLADNTGSTDEHRAINYLAVRSREIYTHTRDMYNRNFSFTGIEVITSRISGIRKIMNVIFTYSSRETRVVEKWYDAVDVTIDLPCPFSEYGIKLKPYMDYQQHI